MIEFTEKEVVETIVALKDAKAEIERLLEKVAKVVGLEQIAAELNAENVALKQQIARLELESRATKTENERTKADLLEAYYEARERDERR